MVLASSLGIVVDPVAAVRVLVQYCIQREIAISLCYSTVRVRALSLVAEESASTSEAGAPVLDPTRPLPFQLFG